MSKDLQKQKCFVISSYNRQAKYLPYNSDDVFRKTYNFDLYVQMSHDDQIKACLETKKNLMVGQGWNIVGPNTNLNFFIEQNFKSIDFQSILLEILTALNFGFSLSEKVFKYSNGKLVIDKIVSIPQDSILFNIDDFGNILSITQYSNSQLTKDLNLDKFILLSYNQTSSNPYGNSDLRAAYVPWFSKTQIRAYLNSFLEKYGLPYIFVKYDQGSEGLVEELQEIVKGLMSSTGAVLPKEVDIEVIDVQKQAVDAFSQVIESYNRAISSALLIPDLLGFNITSGGSYNLGEEQIRIFQLNIDRHRKALEECLNRQLIKQLIDVNFPNVKEEDYPKIEFIQVEKDMLFERVKEYISLNKELGIKPQLDTIEKIMESLKLPFDPSLFEQSTPKPSIFESPTEDSQNPLNEDLIVDRYIPRATTALNKMASLSNEPNRITQLTKLFKYVSNDQQLAVSEDEIKKYAIEVYKEGYELEDLMERVKEFVRLKKGNI